MADVKIISCRYSFLDIWTYGNKSLYHFSKLQTAATQHSAKYANGATGHNLFIQATATAMQNIQDSDFACRESWQLFFHATVGPIFAGLI